MGRPKSGEGAIRSPIGIAMRLRLIEGAIARDTDRSGRGGYPRGLTEVAGRLGLPVRSWRNYRDAVSPIPGVVVLRLILWYGISPAYLLDGVEPMFSSQAPAPARRRARPEASPVQ